MSPGVSFQVDPDQIRSLKSRINAIRRDLLDVHVSNHSLGSATEAGGGEAVFGSSEVAGAVTEFVADWAYGRDVITDQLDGAVVVLDSAAEGYTSAESAIQQAASKGG